MRFQVMFFVFWSCSEFIQERWVCIGLYGLHRFLQSETTLLLCYHLHIGTIYHSSLFSESVRLISISQGLFPPEQIQSVQVYLGIGQIDWVNAEFFSQSFWANLCENRGIFNDNQTFLTAGFFLCTFSARANDHSPDF